jgi:dTDP-4-dehydrorhamnose 3,5-epimerase
VVAVKFQETKLSGAYIVDIEPLVDDRGLFARAWCQREFEALGLNADFVQANVSRNSKRGTLRGLHWQQRPYAECKLVRCTKGAIFDVVVDLRPESDTFKSWAGIELTEQNHRMLLVPEDFAHGFQTLEDDTEVFYQVTQFYTPEAERGALFDDPAFGIDWPLAVTSMSDKDAGWEPFDSQ